MYSLVHDVDQPCRILAKLLLRLLSRVNSNNLGRFQCTLHAGKRETPIGRHSDWAAHTKWHVLCRPLRRRWIRWWPQPRPSLPKKIAGPKQRWKRCSHAGVMLSLHSLMSASRVTAIATCHRHPCMPWPTRASDVLSAHFLWGAHSCFCIAEKSPTLVQDAAAHAHRFQQHQQRLRDINAAFEAALAAEWAAVQKSGKRQAAFLKVPARQCPSLPCLTGRPHCSSAFTVAPCCEA